MSMSDAKSVMDNFMNGLDNNTFTYDEEPTTDNITLDEKFINEQVESYKKQIEKFQQDKVEELVFVKKDNRK